MLPKRLIALFVFAALAFAPGGAAHAQWYLMDLPNSIALISSGKNLVSAAYRGIFVSTDDGRTWTASKLGSHSVHANTLFLSGSILLAGTSNGVYQSTDDGSSWVASSAGLHDEVRCFAKIGTILFAGTLDSGMYRSTDGGASWHPINVGLTKDTIPFVSLGVYTLGAKGSNLYSGLARGQGIFLSTDSGATWSEKNQGLHLDTSFHMQDNAMYVLSIVFLQETIFAGTESGLFRSTDSGKHWIYVDFYPMGGEALIAMGDYLLKSDYRSSDGGSTWQQMGSVDPSFFYLHDSVVFCVDYFHGAIFRSSDSGTTWSLVRASSGGGFSAYPTFIATAKSLLMGGYHIWRSLDSGETWSRTDSGTLLSAVVALTRIGNCIFAGTGTSTDAGVYVSSDEGATWNAANDGLSCNVVQSLATVGSYLFAGAIKDTGVSNPDPRRPPKVWLLGSGIFRSTDNGGSWSEVKDFLGAGDSVWQINLFASETNLFANGLRSTDSGVTWLDNPKNPYPIAVSGNNLFGISNQRVYLSTDEGNAWTPISSGLPSNSQIVWAASGSSIFAGTYDSGVFILSTTSNSWWPINTGLADTQINNLFVADGYLYAVGAMGFWRRPLSEMISPAAVADPPAPKPDLRTYPNPFSQSTTISFTPEASGYADVSVVNLLGVEVARLFAGELTAGEHTFTWNVAGFPAGIYECIVRMNARVQRLKLMVLGD